jgi:hypothetical protein
MEQYRGDDPGTRADLFRISLMERREGAAAARDWVRRTLRIYREALRSPGHFARNKEYRRGFVRSVCVLRSYLRESRARG